MDKKLDLIGKVNMQGEVSFHGIEEAIFEGLKKFTNWIGTPLFVCWILIMVYLAIAGRFDKDETDPEDGRSGMRLYIDNGSGCQYLGSQYGGLTPRLNKAGHHICEGAD